MTLTRSEFVNKCLYVCKQTDESLVKDTIRKCIEDLVQNPNITESHESIPSDESILEYIPSMKTFPDFVYNMCNMKLSKEGVLKRIIGSEYDGITRKRRRVISDSDSDVSESFESDSGTYEIQEIIESDRISTRSRSRRSIPVKETVSLPSILSVFTRKNVSTGKFVSLTNQDEIVRMFFSPCRSISKGVYASENKFVVVTSDSKDKWVSCGIQNKVSWTCPKKEILENIVSNDVSMYVIRKRNNEIRYMGQCINIGNVSLEDCTCDMFVA